MTCPILTPPNNGTITFTPGDDNSTIGLGSVANYSCNLGYVLVGQTTRECQSVFGGSIADWSGTVRVCLEIELGQLMVRHNVKVVYNAV